MPSIETSGDTGVSLLPEMVSSSAAISEPSCKRHALRPEEQLGRAQHIGIVAIVERVAQDDVHQLIDEQVRDLDAAADDVEIGRLDGAVGGQVVAERQHDLPVLARIGVGDRGNLLAATGRRGAASSAACSARSAAQASGGGVELRPGQIDLEEFVGRNESAARVAIEQVVAAGEPEILVRR